MPTELTSQLLAEPLTEKDGTMSSRWYIYFRDRDQLIAATASNVIEPITIEGQNASIGTTPFPTDTLSQGVYRVSYYARITTVAAVASSLTVTFSWTEGGNACSANGAAIVGNTVTTTGTGSAIVRIDGGTPISYAAAYVSNPGAQMVYELVVVLERVGM